MKKWCIKVTADNIDSVESKLKELGYRPDQKWNDYMLPRQFDCIYTYENGEYAIHSHCGSISQSFKNLPVSKLLKRTNKKNDMEQFKKYETVLARWANTGVWLIQAFSDGSYVLSDHGLRCVQPCYQIIPIAGNEHLIGTTDDPKPQPKEGEWWLVKDSFNDIRVMLFHDGKFKGWENALPHNNVTLIHRMIEDKTN